MMCGRCVPRQTQIGIYVDVRQNRDRLHKPHRVDAGRHGRDNQQIASFFREGFEVGIGRTLAGIYDNVRVFG